MRDKVWLDPMACTAYVLYQVSTGVPALQLSIPEWLGKTDSVGARLR